MPLRFYRDGLGLETRGVIGAEFEHGAVVFFDLEAGLKLALYPRAYLAKDTGLILQKRDAPNPLKQLVGRSRRAAEKNRHTCNTPRPAQFRAG